MAIIPKFAARMSKGKLTVTDQSAFLGYLSKFNDKDRLTVTVSKETKERSLQSNKYLWGVCYKVFVDATGHTANEIHEIMKRKLLPPKIIEIGGERHKVSGSTKDLNTVEMYEFIEGVRRIAAENGWHIPDPQSVTLS